MVSEIFFVEISVLLLYFLAIYFAYRIGKLDFLIYGTVFSAVFENLNVLFFSNSIAGYYYSKDFLIYIFHVPLFIILSWGILLLGAHLVSLKLRMSKISRVFFLAFFVALIDFVIEGVSVNMGYWVWTGVGGGGNIFSNIAPANFVGWLGVSFGFILCYEYLGRKWESMILGYFVFLILGAFSKTITFFVGDDGYFSLVVILFLFFGAWIYFYHKNEILKKNLGDFRVDFGRGKYIVWMRGFFYLFGLFYWIRDEYYLDLVYVVVVGVVFLIEGYFFLRFNRFLKKMV